jgi:mono/diheme cytochrome c family protein
MKSASVVAAVVMFTLFGVAAAFLPDGALNHGMEVYAAQKCALCHSISGIGGKKRALDGVGSKMKPDAIKKWILTPKAVKADTTMKAYPNLPDKDLDDLTAYLMTLQ